MVWWRKCSVCGRVITTQTYSSVALHRFPKDPSTWKAWKEFCKLPEDYPLNKLKNYKVCSLHFTASDYMDAKAKLVGGRLTLKSGAVPSVSVLPVSKKKSCRKPQTSCTSSLQENDVFYIDIQVRPSTPEEMPTNNTINSEVKCDDQYDSESILSFDSKMEITETENSDENDCVILDDCNEECSTIIEHNNYAQTVQDISGEGNIMQCSAPIEDNYAQTSQDKGVKENIANIPGTLKKRRFANPRFISEVETSDMATPKEARRTLNFIKEEDKKKTAKLKKLERINTALRERINTLLEMVKSLKMRNCASEGTTDVLTINKTRDVCALEYSDDLLKVPKNLIGKSHRCDICRRYWSKSIFFIRNHVRRHQSTSQSFDCEKNQIEEYFCRDCNFTTNQLIIFKNHFNNSHLHNEQNTTTYICKYCPFESYSLLVWMKHDCCEISTRQTNTNTNLKSDKIKWFECEQCDHKSKKKYNLNNHILAKHTSSDKTKTLKCHHCNYITKTSSLLKVHMIRKHTSGDKINWMRCSECDYKSKIRHDLKRHMILKHSMVMVKLNGSYVSVLLQNLTKK